MVAAATLPSPGVFMQVQALTDVNQRLQSSLADTTKAHQAERLKRDNLHKQVVHQFSHCILLKAQMKLAFTSLDGGKNTKDIHWCLHVCCHDHSKLNILMLSCPS